MDFLGIGSGELLLIVVIALILWGPGRVVEMSRAAGKLIHNIRKEAGELTSQITRELDDQKKTKPESEKPVSAGRSPEQ